MDARKSSILEILDGSRQFIIPVYQRSYSWEEKQCKRLREDIVRLEKDKRPGHFIGSIVNIAQNPTPVGVQKFIIIDGQQRLTTISILLIALRDFLINNPSKSDLDPKSIHGKHLINEHETGEDSYKLILTENDKDFLLGLLDERNIDKSKKSKIYETYDYYYKNISKGDLNPREVYEAIGKLQLVNITLDHQSDDPQAIFESLNSTGKDLSESDLIRNFLLMDMDSKRQNYIYREYRRPLEKFFITDDNQKDMDDFFRHYLTMKLTDIPNKGKVYEEFKYYSENFNTREDDDLYQDLYNFAKIYTDIIYDRIEDQKLKKLYEDISRLQMEVSYPFIMRVHNDWKRGILSKEELVEILILCISYVVRRNICDLPTNSLNKTFASLKKYIDPDNYLKSFKAYLLVLDKKRVFPDDLSFSESFINRDIYNMRINNYLLTTMENYDNKSHIENLDSFTIEHIMPQNKNLSESWKKSLGDNWEEVHTKYLNTIGNITLTAYNSEMSDRPFKEKLNMKGGFIESGLRLNSYVVKQDDWNEEKILERDKILLEEAKSIWPYPSLSTEEITAYNEKKEKKDSISKYSLNSYDTNEYTLELFESLNEKIMEISPDVKKNFNKLYISYKYKINFVDVIFQKNRLQLILNMKFPEIMDPQGLCVDVANKGHWGNGDVRVYLKDLSQLDYIMDLIYQSFDTQYKNTAKKKM